MKFNVTLSHDFYIGINCIFFTRYLQSWSKINNADFILAVYMYVENLYKRKFFRQTG